MVFNRQVAIYADFVSVTGRLQELGISEVVLRTALEFGYRHWAQCTPNDPLTAPGYIAWAKTTAELRNLLVPEGWRVSNKEGYATTVHPSGSFAIVVAGGNEATAEEECSPVTRTAKGPRTESAIRANQLSLADYNAAAFGPLPDSAIRPPEQTRILLHRFDKAQGVIKAELSLPTEMNGEVIDGLRKRGKVDGWSERIILSDIPLDASGADIFGNTTPPTAGTSSEIDIPVERKIS